jgi:glycosyltransferase involved in cell wall biosynthesis
VIQMISICVCTHSPRERIFRLAINSLAQQYCDPGQIEVLVIDNGSEPPLTTEFLEPLRAAKISARLIYEPKVGISNARYRAIQETNAPWLLFVDDDNELDPDYITKGLEFISGHPEVGCFGGKLLLPRDMDVPAWAEPFLPFLAIKDLGDETKIGIHQVWTECEPPGAGAWVRRDVAEMYMRSLDEDSTLRSLGRASKTGLSSSDDSCMMRSAGLLGLANAYYPGLKLRHHLAPHRFTYAYILKLFAGYGESQLILEKGLTGSHPLEDCYADPEAFSKLLDHIFFHPKTNGRYKLAEMRRHLAARALYAREETTNDQDLAHLLEEIAMRLDRPRFRISPHFKKAKAAIADKIRSLSKDTRRSASFRGR